MNMETVYLSLGTNRGDREGLLRRACEMIGERIGIPVRASSLYESDPWGFEDPVSFYNMITEIKTALSPEELLVNIREIENLLGRSRADDIACRRDGAERTYEPRIMDIDILFYGSKMFAIKDLIIPHPLLHKRRFILLPMFEISPDLVHPGLKKTIGELLALCQDKGRVARLKQ